MNEGMNECLFRHKNNVKCSLLCKKKYKNNKIYKINKLLIVNEYIEVYISSYTCVVHRCLSTTWTMQ